MSTPWVDKVLRIVERKVEDAVEAEREAWREAIRRELFGGGWGDLREVPESPAHMEEWFDKLAASWRE